MTVAQSDIEAILLRSLTATETTYVARLTAMAEAQVNSMLPGFSIATGTATNEVIPYTDPDVMWTAHYPVTALTSLKVDGSTLSTSSYRWNEKGRIELGHWVGPDDFELNLSGLGAWSTVTATYPYGITPLPADLAAAVAAVVAAHFRRGATNPGGVQSESLGVYSVTYAVAAAESGGLAPPPAELLRRWSRNTQVSVPLVRYR